MYHNIEEAAIAAARHRYHTPHGASGPPTLAPKILACLAGIGSEAPLISLDLSPTSPPQLRSMGAPYWTARISFSR